MAKPPEDQIRIYQEPKFVRPTLIAAWPGISNVALEATGYLKEKLGAAEFAEIESPLFFEFGGVYVEKNLVQPPRLPQNKFYYWKRKGTARQREGDLIIFIGEAQPTSRGREFADKILGLCQGFGVNDVYTFAAALVSQFTDQPRVWAAATDDDQLADLEKQGLALKGDFFIAGMNGLLLSVAREKGMRATCLLGETPRYMSEMRNPIASKAVLEVLTRLLKVDIDMREMNEMAEQASQQIEEVVRESRRQFIKDFTVPLWERSEEEGEG